MKKYAIEIKWGIVFMVVALLWMWLERLMGLHDEHIADHALYTNLFTIPAIAAYVIALLDKRRNYYSGVMTWKEGFRSGFVITVIVTILSPLAQVITIEVITPEYFANVIAYSVSQGKMTQEDAESYFNLKNYMIQAPVGSLIMGMATSAVIAIFTQKKGS